MTDLTIEGETFRVEFDGDADRPVLMLSNSLGSDLTLWDAQMKPFLEHFRVLRYDSRGHGRSTDAGAPYSIDRLGKDALAILDQLEIGSAHFAGISMGGAVGQWLLVNAPERIERAVLASTTARFGTPDLWNTRIEAVRTGGMNAIATATMERWFSVAFHQRAPDRVKTIEEMFCATRPEGYAACCAALRDMDMREALRGIDRPVLIVTGIDDPVTSPSDVAAMTAAIGHAEHVALDCKHLSNIELADDFTAAVISFLTAKAPARPGRARLPRKATAPRRLPVSRRASPARSPLKPAVAKTTVTKAAATKPTAAKPKARKPVVAKAAAPKRAMAKPAAARRRAAIETVPRPSARVSAKPARSTATKPTAGAPAKPRRVAKAAASTSKPAASKPAASKTRTSATAASKKTASKTARAKTPTPNRAKTKRRTTTPVVAQPSARARSGGKTAKSTTTRPRTAPKAKTPAARPTKRAGRPGSGRKR